MSHTRPALRAEALEDRLTPAGGLDPTFGTGGKLTASPGPTVNVVLHVVVQPDGKFLVAGENPSYDFSVTRLNPDGSPDPTFAGGLGTAIDFAGASDFVDAMTLQPDGRIVMAGSAVVPFGSGTQLPIDMAVARVNPDGTTDTTFGDGGKAF